ncbi:hypothetical protein BJY52DRAFT_1418585 [Lactarius psammicola]|nr:hypothetical protein BJY52DRAFT_1418585 [Lactarius psammicola]
MRNAEVASVFGYYIRTIMILSLWLGGVVDVAVPGVAGMAVAMRTPAQYAAGSVELLQKGSAVPAAFHLGHDDLGDGVAVLADFSVVVTFECFGDVGTVSIEPSSSIGHWPSDMHTSSSSSCHSLNQRKPERMRWRSRKLGIGLKPNSDIYVPQDEGLCNGANVVPEQPTRGSHPYRLSLWQFKEAVVRDKQMWTVRTPS